MVCALLTATAAPPKADPFAVFPVNVLRSILEETGPVPLPVILIAAP